MKRSLPSVRAQLRQPEVVTLVLDCKEDKLSADRVRSIYRSIWADSSVRPELVVLRNRRTGLTASGAWNSGIDELCRRCEKEEDQWYVAMLDDDDAWTESHLEECGARAEKTQADMVIPGIIRHEAESDEGRRQSIPDRLDENVLFVKNPHIQGSNMFVRLSRLLEAGGFDENLPSCTDRDLCIRLSRLIDFTCSSLGTHTVHHYADRRDDRLTVDQSAKQRGLVNFWKKHSPDFPENLYDEFFRIVKERFGFNADIFESSPCRDASSVAEPGSCLPAQSSGLYFVIGVATDSSIPAQARGLLKDIKSLPSHPGVRGVTAVLYENGPVSSQGREQWKVLVHELGEAGVKPVWIKPEEAEKEWLPHQTFHDEGYALKRLPIAVTRSILNYYVWRECRSEPDSVAWILDDDKTFEFEVRSGGLGTPSRRRSPDVAQLLALRSQGVDVVIGQDSAAAPLPFESTLRLQMLDVEAMLRRSVTNPNRTNDSVLDAADGKYYDLSRETKFLESPNVAFGSEAISGGPVTAVREAIRVCKRMRAGESVTRPLMVDASDIPVSAAKTSVLRGGSTIFFNAEHLMLCPQYVTRVGNDWVRRSDMVHSLVLRDVYRLNVVMHASASVRHGRERVAPISAISDTFAKDVLGYGFYHGVRQVLEKDGGPCAKTICGLFSHSDTVATAAKAAGKAIRERLAATHLSAWRIKGLVGSCLRQIGQLEQSGQISQTLAQELKEELGLVGGLLTPGAIRNQVPAVDHVLEAKLASSYRKLDLDAVAMQYKCLKHHRAILDAHREARARNLAGLGSEVEFIGSGWEGVVFRDGDDAIKVFDMAKAHRLAEALPVLERLNHAQFTPRCLSRVSVMPLGEHVVAIRRRYVEGVETGPPSLAQMVELIQELRRAGLVFRNLSPANYVLHQGSLRIVDYGVDFSPHEEQAFRVMMRKAWLCLRLSRRHDLKALLTRSIHTEDMPELDGYPAFEALVLHESKSATQLCDELVDLLVDGRSPGRLLDYGCGKQAYTARRMNAIGWDVVGFDPGAGMLERWGREIPEADRLKLTSSRADVLAHGGFDLAVCSLVICELSDEAALSVAVADLASSIGKEGRLALIFCDPLGTFGHPTTVHVSRNVPEGGEYSRQFAYEEIAESGRPRVEYHRPLRVLRRLLASKGLSVRREVFSRTTDVHAGLPATDFLGWECVPADLTCADASVSLLIKGSALEGRTLDHQVRHLVEQLESPRAFLERILVLDSKMEEFTRQYGRPDMDSARDAAERLLREGYVDKVIYAPDDGDAPCAEINKRWFGVDSHRSHSQGKAPLAAPLMGFEVCQGDYILQVDSDLLIRRTERYDDFVGHAIQRLRNVPGAMTSGLSILQSYDAELGPRDKEGVPYRVECRGCLFDRKMLMGLRPFPNSLSPDGFPELSWHRSMDVACKEGRFQSLRHASSRSGFVHPPNAFKRSTDEWNLVMAAIETGAACPKNFGLVDVVGSALEWLPTARSERFVFIVTGRNVPYGKMLRCYESMARQSGPDWGAVVIDDGSDELTREGCRRIFAGDSRITLLQPRVRRGQLANTALAIRHLCSDSGAVVITLDMDDALIGDDVLIRLDEAYAKGADVTVGSMVRTDKPADYEVRFDDLNAARGGNVWTHLRTFRKRLFDAIPDWRLRLDGKYVSICVDWAFMVPIVEKAKQPVFLNEKLYYYETSGLGKSEQREVRDAAIGRLMRRYRKGGHCPRSSELVTKEQIAAMNWGGRNGVLIIRHADRPSLKGLGKEADEVSITPQGVREAFELGKAIGLASSVVSSGVLRSRQTAQEILRALGRNPDELRTYKALCRLSGVNRQAYDGHKQRLGWHALVDVWVDGGLSDHEAILRSHESGLEAVRELLTCTEIKREGLTIAVSHDFCVQALLEAVHGVRNWRGKGVPTLSGVYLDYDDAEQLIRAYDI